MCKKVVYGGGAFRKDWREQVFPPHLPSSPLLCFNEYGHRIPHDTPFPPYPPGPHRVAAFEEHLCTCPDRPGLCRTRRHGCRTFGLRRHSCHAPCPDKRAPRNHRRHWSVGHRHALPHRILCHPRGRDTHPHRHAAYAPTPHRSAGGCPESPWSRNPLRGRGRISAAPHRRPQPAGRAGEHRSKCEQPIHFGTDDGRGRHAAGTGHRTAWKGRFTPLY